MLNTEKLAYVKTRNKIIHIRHAIMAIVENNCEKHAQPLYYLHLPANVNTKDDKTNGLTTYINSASDCTHSPANVGEFSLNNHISQFDRRLFTIAGHC